LDDERCRSPFPGSVSCDIRSDVDSSKSGKFLGNQPEIRLGKWPEMARFHDRLQAKLSEQNGVEAPLTAAVTLLAGRLDWEHRDPFDRMLAATAILTGSILISADQAFDGIAVRRVW
jgi:PIN domain nuclease of toxin-antitoxin system